MLFYGKGFKIFKAAIHAYSIHTHNWTTLGGGKICGVDILPNATNCGNRIIMMQQGTQQII